MFYMLYFSSSMLLYFYYLYQMLIYQFNDLFYYHINWILMLLSLWMLPMLLLMTNDKKELSLIMFMFINLILLFNMNTLLYFYLFFEFIIILLLIYILMYGKSYLKLLAFYSLWIYAIFSSMLLFLSMVLMHYYLGSDNFYLLKMYINYSNYKYLLFMFIMMPLLVKLPIIPFHSWLPLLHVEANTLGSIILASIMLKIAIYGLLILNYDIFIDLFSYYSNMLMLIALISIIMTSMWIINLIDIKQIIAYSSMMHMNIMLLAIMANYWYGSLYSSMSHGMMSSGLFFIMGCFYNRYHTSMLMYYKGLMHLNKLFSMFFMLLLLANMSLPMLSSNFMPELTIFIKFFNINSMILIMVLLSIMFMTMFNMKLMNMMNYGHISKYLLKWKDLSYKEFMVLVMLSLSNMLMSMYGMNLM